MAWDDRSAAFRAGVRLPAATSPQGGVATLTLKPAAANTALEARGTLQYFVPPVVAAVSPSRATVDGLTSAVGGRSVAVTVRGLPSATRPADLAVSFAQDGGGELMCDGAACSLLQVFASYPAPIPAKKHLATWPPHPINVSHCIQIASRGAITLTRDRCKAPSERWCSPCRFPGRVP